MVAENQNIFEILFPYANERVNKIKDENQKFVHYTSAEVAMSIIRNKAIWMRNSRMMNDTSEVHHGIACVDNALKSAVGEQFKSMLNSRCGNVFEAAHEIYNNWKTGLTDATYLTCVSEHDVAKDKFGRSFMWENYGEGEVAIVMNHSPFFDNNVSNLLKIYASPVLYSCDSNDVFQKEFEEMVKLVTENIEWLADKSQTSSGRKDVFWLVFRVLVFAAMSTKHPDYREEQEWRIIYPPSIENRNCWSMRLFQ